MKYLIICVLQVIFTGDDLKVYSCFLLNSGPTNKGKYVYAQIVEFLFQWFFDNLVMKYYGNKYVKHITCWNQLLVMIFGQTDLPR